MRDFHQFCEAKKKDADLDPNDTRSIRAVVDLADAIRKVFARYSRATRDRAWRKITSQRGMREINNLLRTPGRSLNRFRSLTTEQVTDFAQWFETHH